MLSLYIFLDPYKKIYEINSKIFLFFFQFGKSSVGGKLGVMVQSLCWSQDSSMLVAMQVQLMHISYILKVLSNEKKGGSCLVSF